MVEDVENNDKNDHQRKTEKDGGNDDDKDIHRSSEGAEIKTTRKENKETEDKLPTDLTTFEELLDLCGTEGRWNLMMFLICAFSGFVSPMQVMSYQFLGATPDHWCQVEELYGANWTDEQVLSLAIPVDNMTGKHDGCQMYDLNYTTALRLGYETSLDEEDLLHTTTRNNSNATNLLSCPHRQFNLTQYSSTVVTEWDLVCERRALYSTTFAASSMGKLIAYLTLAYPIDYFGRRPVVLVCSVLLIIAGFLIAASSTVEMYIVLSTFASVMDSGMYLGCYILSMEVVSSKKRSVAGALFEVPYAIGYMVLPGMCYFIRTWKLLQVVLTLPALYTLIFFWFFPESPRWLILQGRYEEALKVFHWAAKVNRRTLPSDQFMLQAMENLPQPLQDSDENRDDEHSKKGTIRWLLNILKQCVILFLTPELRPRTLIVYFCWFTVSIVYYGMALNATNLSTDTYLYIFLGGLLEVPSYLMLWMAIVYLGRKKTFVALYFLSAVSSCLITAMMLLVPGGAMGATVVMSHAGKYFITAAFNLAWMYTAELFPTKYRPLAVGQASVCARVGSLFSPYINDILGEIVVWAPTALFGGLSMIAALLATALPETLNQDLPDNIDFSKKKKKSLKKPEESPPDNPIEDVQGDVNLPVVTETHRLKNTKSMMNDDAEV